MKKLMMGAAMLAAVGMVAGCFTSARAYTETKHADGSVTVSRVNIIGTGDKASEIAAEGLFVDGTQDDLGAGVKSASATQQSTGIKETLGHGRAAQASDRWWQTRGFRRLPLRSDRHAAVAGGYSTGASKLQYR